jgi:hypothetical protein
VIKHKTLFAVVICAFVVLNFPTNTYAEKSKPPKPHHAVNLDLVSPSRADKPDEPLSVQFRAGWPLTFKITVKDEDMLGVGTMFGSNDAISNFPEIRSAGALVLEDPDGCWSRAGGGGPYSGCGQYDETFITFYPDRGDLHGLADDTGHFIQHAVLRNPIFRPAFGGPSIYGELPGESNQTIIDGVGWGADDDIPNLVILSNVGGGIVLKDENWDPDYVPGVPEFWEPVYPAQARNTAGFMSSVGYELSTTRGETSITATMIVPRHLYSSTRLVDSCTGIVDETVFPPTCSGTSIQRTDGLPEEDFNPWLVNETLVELRAFVATEPIDILSDLNGDGMVSAEDATLAGFNVLSDEVVFHLRQILPEIDVNHCNGLDTPSSGYVWNGRGTDVYVDLDGNGYGQVPSISCPPGSGGYERPPN